MINDKDSQIIVDFLSYRENSVNNAAVSNLMKQESCVQLYSLYYMFFSRGTR